MDYLAIRERSVRRLARWKLSDPGVLPLHCDEDFDWMRDARERRGALPRDRGRARAAAGRAAASASARALDDNDLERWLGARELRLLRHLERERRR